MISVRIEAAQLSYRRHYFADQPAAVAAAGLAEFACCGTLEKRLLYHRQPEFTKFIDLRQPQERLLKSFHEQCRYEIRRAEREGVVCSQHADFGEYFAFHQDFCRSKRRPAPSWSFFVAHREHLLITRAMLDLNTLCVHAYLLDPTVSRARLFTSASLFRRETTGALRALIGRANRLLHYKDMLQLAARGFQIYDFGGYAPDTTDPDLIGLNQFKDWFGGTLASESTHVSLSLALARGGLSLARRLRRFGSGAVRHPHQR